MTWLNLNFLKVALPCGVECSPPWTAWWSTTARRMIPGTPSSQVSSQEECSPSVEVWMSLSKMPWWEEWFSCWSKDCPQSLQVCPWDNNTRWWRKCKRQRWRGYRNKCAEAAQTHGQQTTRLIWPRPKRHLNPSRWSTRQSHSLSEEEDVTVLNHYE